MATRKPVVKKNKVEAAKKPAKTDKKQTAKKALTKKKPAAKKIATKKIVVKPAKPLSAPAVKKAEKKGLAKPMVKVVVDRMPLPKGGKIFVKAAKRPTAKKQAKKTK